MPEPRKEPVGDLEILCPQCGKDWILTEKERRRIVIENLPKPKRCPECRVDGRPS